MNDIVLHFDEKINEYPGEMTGFMMMFLSLFFYVVGGFYAIMVGMSNTITIIMIGTGVLFQICIPVGGIIEVCCSGKGEVEEGIKNSFKGAGSVFWCCCYGGVCN